MPHYLDLISLSREEYEEKLRWQKVLPPQHREETWITFEGHLWKLGVGNLKALRRYWLTEGRSEECADENIRILSRIIYYGKWFKVMTRPVLPFLRSEKHFKVGSKVMGYCPKAGCKGEKIQVPTFYLGIEECTSVVWQEDGMYLKGVVQAISDAPKPELTVYFPGAEPELRYRKYDYDSPEIILEYEYLRLAGSENLDKNRWRCPYYNGGWHRDFTEQYFTWTSFHYGQETPCETAGLRALWAQTGHRRNYWTNPYDFG